MSTAPTSTIAASRILRAGAIAAGVAAIANLVVFLIGKAAGVPFEVSMGGTKSSVVFLQPLLASFIAVFIGAVALWLLSRLANGVAIWSGLAVVGVVLYTLLAISAATATSTKITLTIMHLVAFAVAWVMLRPAAVSD